MIRYHMWDRGLVAAFGSTFYGLCRRAEQPDECGLPQEYNVMQLSLGNNRKTLVDSSFYGIVKSKGVNKLK